METTFKAKRLTEVEIKVTLPYYFQLGDLFIYCKQISAEEALVVSRGGIEIRNSFYIEDPTQHEISEHEFNDKFDAVIANLINQAQ